MMRQFEVRAYMGGVCITEYNPAKYQWDFAWGYTRIVKWLIEPEWNGRVYYSIDKGMV